MKKIEKCDEEQVNDRMPGTFIVQAKEIVKRSAIDSTAHGFSNIAQASSWPLRLAWIVCLLLASGYCTYCVIGILIDYVNYPVVSNVEVVNEVATSFPTVMFCNINPFNTDLENATSYMHTVQARFPFNSSLLTSEYSFFTTESLKSIIYAEYGFHPEFVRNISHLLHMSMISCSFASTSCSMDDFELIYVYDYISCYRFNANGTRMTSRRGFSYGLQLELYIGNSSSLDDALYFGNRGIRYMVMNSSLGQGFIYDEGSDASPGEVTNVEITKRYTDRLSSPYSDCLDDLSPENPDQTFTMKIMFQELNQTKYSQLYCQSVCLQSAIIEKCGCFVYRYPFSASMIKNIGNSPCLVSNYTNCALPTIQSISSSGSTCLSDCKTECKFFDYDSTVTTSEYMTNWYWSHLKNYSTNYVAADNTLEETQRQWFFNTLGQIETLSEARDSTLKLNVFLNHIGYYSTSESPFYSFNSLLGALGGQLGLFMGVSLLSFMELFEIVYLIVEAWLSLSLVKKQRLQIKPKPVD